MVLTGDKKLIAPCGLYCGTCAFYHKSEIRKAARRLKEMLDGFERIAKIYEKVAPELKDYPKFMRVMEYFGRQDCLGCRFGGGKEHGAACMPETCTMVLCPTDKGLDFCYQCPDFPCKIIPFTMKKAKNEGLVEIWLKCNRRMKKIGLDRYLKEKKTEPRYGINKRIKARKP